MSSEETDALLLHATTPSQRTPSRLDEDDDHELHLVQDPENDVTSNPEQEMKAQILASEGDNGLDFALRPTLLLPVALFLVACILSLVLDTAVTALRNASTENNALSTVVDLLPLLTMVVITLGGILRLLVLRQRFVKDQRPGFPERLLSGRALFLLLVKQTKLVPYVRFMRLMRNGNHLVALFVAATAFSIIMFVSPHTIEACQTNHWVNTTTIEDSCITAAVQLTNSFVTNSTCTSCARAVIYMNNSSFYMLAGTLMAFVITLAIVPSERSDTIVRRRYEGLANNSPLSMLFVETASRVSFVLLPGTWLTNAKRRLSFAIIASSSTLLYLVILCISIWWQITHIDSTVYHEFALTWSLFSSSTPSLFWVIGIMDMVVVALTQVCLVHLIIVIFPSVLLDCHYQTMAMSVFLLSKYEFVLPFVHTIVDDGMSPEAAEFDTMMVSPEQRKRHATQGGNSWGRSERTRSMDIEKDTDGVDGNSRRPSIWPGAHGSGTSTSGTYGSTQAEQLPATMQRAQSQHEIAGFGLYCRTMLPKGRLQQLISDERKKPIVFPQTPDEIIAFYQRARVYLMTWMAARRFHFHNIINFNLSSMTGVIIFLALVAIVCMLTVLLMIIFSPTSSLTDVLFRPNTALLSYVGFYAIASFTIILTHIMKMMDNTQFQLMLLNHLIRRSYARFAPFDWPRSAVDEKVMIEVEAFERMLQHQCLLLEFYEQRPKFLGFEMHRSYYNMFLGYLAAYAATFFVSILSTLV